MNAAQEAGFAIITKIGEGIELRERLEADRDEAERKAIDALSRYKFQIFGYWAAIWVHLNRVIGDGQRNPFASYVRLAKDHKAIAEAEVS